MSLNMILNYVDLLLDQLPLVNHEHSQSIPCSMTVVYLSEFSFFLLKTNMGQPITMELQQSLKVAKQSG